MTEYPKHISYINREIGKRLHGVARDPREEERLRATIQERGHHSVEGEPVSEMEDRERRRLIELEDVPRKEAETVSPDKELPF